jgi:sugar phosphate isomerase/epimerase
MAYNRHRMKLKLGYITNGFRDHALEDVFPLLADLGYAGVGITLDHGHLHPYRSPREEILRVRDLLRRHGLEPVIETGGRFVLDPRRKHHPTLISAAGRERRLDFLLRAHGVAEALGARALSFWSGAADPGLTREESWKHLLEGLGALERETRGSAVALAFEPEPGMFVAGLDDFRELRSRFPSPALRLTLDLGHLQCTEEPPHDRWLREFAAALANVHVDDVRGRRHEHLPLGEGEIDFPPLFRALDEIRYEGLCLVELSRHSHAAPEMAARSIEFLGRVLAR